jgi:hypothetical protein
MPGIGQQAHASGSAVRDGINIMLRPQQKIKPGAQEPGYIILKPRVNGRRVTCDEFQRLNGTYTVQGHLIQTSTCMTYKEPDGVTLLSRIYFGILSPHCGPVDVKLEVVVKINGGDEQTITEEIPSFFEYAADAPEMQDDPRKSTIQLTDFIFHSLYID